MIPIASTSYHKQRRRQSSIPSNFKTQKSNIEVLETDLIFHYELKIPGYVKEDFNFYINSNDLVVTTDKSKSTPNPERHSYCYPSAYFRMKIALPEEPIKKEIIFDYRDEVLCFDLFKLD